MYIYELYRRAMELTFEKYIEKNTFIKYNYKYKVIITNYIIKKTSNRRTLCKYQRILKVIF